MARVLVVDDDVTVREVVVSYLRAGGHDVAESADGAAALKQMREAPADLVVLDLMMPDVNGFDVVAALHALADTAKIPILVVTAKQMSVDERAALDGRVAAVLDKGGLDGGCFADAVRRATSGRVEA